MICIGRPLVDATLQRVTRNVALILAAALAHPAAAAPILDQSSVLTQSVGGLITVTDFTPAQSFTVGAGGLLSQIDVQIRRDVGVFDDAFLDVWASAGNGPTGASPLFSVTIPNSEIPELPNTLSVPFTSVDVTSAGLNVQPGEQYVVALRRSAPFGDPVVSWAWGRPEYPGGAPYSTAFGRPWEQEASDIDFAFQTWVEPPPRTLDPPGPLYRLMETARPLPPDSPFLSGIGVSENVYIGANFEIRRPTRIQSVGGNFVSGSPGQVFAAIVEIDNINGRPNPTDLSGDDVLGVTLLDLPAFSDSPADVSGDLDLTLQPGFYGLWVGSGRFGATGSTSLYSDNDPVGSKSTWSLAQPSGNVGFFDSTLRLFADASSATGTLQTFAAVDAEAEMIGSNFVLADNEEFAIDIWRNFFQGIDRRGLFEFDISEIPPQAVIESAVLELDANGRQGGGGNVPQIQIHGYAGDGQIDPADAESPLNLLGISPPIDDLDVFEVNLDTAYIQSLLGNTDFLGLMGLGGPDGLQLTVSPLESGSSLPQPAFLTIAYSIPGDGDQDLDVDVADLMQMQRDDLSAGALQDWNNNSGVGANEVLVDVDDDGDVDLADLLALQRNPQPGQLSFWRPRFGEGAISASGVTAIPEPAAWVLALAVVGCARLRE